MCRSIRRSRPQRPKQGGRTGFRAGHYTRLIPKRSPFAGTMDQARPPHGLSRHPMMRSRSPQIGRPVPHEPHQATALRRSRTEASARRLDDATGIDSSRPVTEAPCAMGRKNAHGFDRYCQNIPAFPAQWFGGLYVLSPVSGLFCHRCGTRTGRADRRQGRGARTTRLRRPLLTFRPVQAPDASCGPSQPAPRSRDDRANVPHGGTGCADLCRKSEFR